MFEKTKPDDWHLSNSEPSRSLTKLEFGVERLVYSYFRWKVACISSIEDAGLTAEDISVLNLIRKDDQPKKLTEIARMLNRSDVSNLQYAVRKLTKEGLISKQDNSSRKDTTYLASPKGVSITTDYADTRNQLLIQSLGGQIDLAELEAAANTLSRLTGLYDQAIAHTKALWTQSLPITPPTPKEPEDGRI